MKRLLSLMIIGWIAGSPAASAQQSEIAELKAELRRQQESLAALMRKIEEMEKRSATTVTKEELKQETETQAEAVSSLRETVASKVNLAGYYNFRYQNSSSEAVGSFQQQNLALILSKQLQRWNFLLEVELQNQPHHREIVPEGKGGGEGSEEGEDVSGEGAFSVENAWMEYNQHRALNVRLGKQLSPQYWWTHRYPNLTFSTDLPIHLRDLFPPELMGAMVHGSVARPVRQSELGLGYKFYVSNNEVANNTRRDLLDRKAVGGRLEFKLPTAGVLKRFDLAVDLYNGRIGLSDDLLVSDTVWGYEGQIELDRFLLYGEYARGNSMGAKRFGYYLQPAYRLGEQWTAFYRNERLKVSLTGRDETRHLAGLNFRPFPQIALKAEYVRSLLPREEHHLEPEEHHRKSRTHGFAAAAVFFF